MMTQSRTTTTHRTRKDLRYLADRTNRDGASATWGTFTGEDAARNRRLVDHGWLTSQGRFTAIGSDVARVAETLDQRDVLDLTIDIVGMGAFVDACADMYAVDALSYFAGVRTLYNLFDEAKHQARQGYEGFLGDHDDPADALVEFDTSRGAVEVRFEDLYTAIEFKKLADRFDVERKHDERFKSNRNSKRLVVSGLY